MGTPEAVVLIVAAVLIGVGALAGLVALWRSGRDVDAEVD